MTLPSVGITSVDDFSPVYEGDTLVSFSPQFWQWNGTTSAFAALDITNLTPGMKMTDGTTIKTCSGAWTKPDPTHGIASYAWQSADVDASGVWTLYITLTDGGGHVGHTETKTLEIKGAP